MGRLTEYMHYINQKELDKDDKLAYTHLTITDDIKKIRKKNLLEKKTGLKVEDNGSFNLF